MPQALTNKIMTPDGTVLQSYSRHDYQQHRDKNSELYFTDGGLAYQRRSANQQPYVDLSVYDGDRFARIREEFVWGTYGVNGDQPLRRVALCDLDYEHCEAILRTQHQLPDYIRSVFKQELALRDVQLQERLRKHCVQVKDPDLKLQNWQHIQQLRNNKHYDN